MKLLSYGMLLVALLVMGGCCLFQGYNYVKTIDGCKVPVSCKCDPLVMYNAGNFKFGGFDITLPQAAGTTVKIGEIDYKTDSVREAAELVQGLDMYRVTCCNNLGAKVASSHCQDVSNYVDTMNETEMKMQQLDAILKSNSPQAPDAMRSWIQTYGTRVQAAKITPKENIKSVPLETILK